MTLAVIPEMTATAFLIPGTGLPAGIPRRFALALVISAAFHLLFGAVLALDPVPRSARLPAAAPIAVRLVPDAAPRAADPPRAEVVESLLPVPRVRRRTPAAASEQRTDREEEGVQPAREVAASLALPQVPDQTYYAAHELDVYPRPVAPLNWSPLAGAARDGFAGRARLSLDIDEQGMVKRVAIVESEPAGPLEDGLRAVLTATRFVPARKDGRAVKSRVLLSIDFARAGEEQGAALKGR